jgi:DNA/RNA endonuclease YhcR with UshA esterase domain|tara:strand:- start:517 stop:888 length:372 start_codon:yes stop_codon:yes gene_type:complete
MLKRNLIIIAALVCIAFAQEQSIASDKAIDYVGEYVTVCGEVVSAHFASRSRGKPTFLNIDEPYPRQTFTVVIWGNNRNKFGGDPENTLLWKDVCVTGRVEIFRGVAQVTAKSSDQITVSEEK